MQALLALTYRDCPTCQQLRAFEQPPCIDEHGGECPEWLCIDCGFALLVGMSVEAAAPRVIVAAA